MTQQRVEDEINLGWIFSLLTPSNRKRALDEAADDMAEYAKVTMDAAMDAIGLVLPPPDQRLGFYYIKTIEEWEEQRAKFPEDFEWEQRDFERLREREAKGDLVPFRLARKPVQQPSGQETP